MKVLRNNIVIASSEITITINSDDTVTGTLQNELTDEGKSADDVTDDVTLKEGDEIQLTLTADQQKQIIDAVKPILSDAINAMTPSGVTTEVVASEQAPS